MVLVTFLSTILWCWLPCWPIYCIAKCFIGYYIIVLFIILAAILWPCWLPYCGVRYVYVYYIILLCWLLYSGVRYIVGYDIVVLNTFFGYYIMVIVTFLAILCWRLPIDNYIVMFVIFFTTITLCWLPYCCVVTFLATIF